MQKPPQPQWQPIEKLSLIAYIIDGTLQSTHESFNALQQASPKPYSLDDATVNRAIKLYTEQKDGLWEFDEQLRRWKTQPLSSSERAEIERLQDQMLRLHSINSKILTLTGELKKKTIEALLAKSDYEVGLEYVNEALQGTTNSNTATDKQAVNKDPISYYFFHFPIKLAVHDRPDGNTLSSVRFHVTFPILPRQYAAFEAGIGPLSANEKPYGEILEAMVMQTMQRDAYELLEGLLADHPTYPDAEVRVHIDGKITRSGEACWIREEIQVGEMFRQIP